MRYRVRHVTTYRYSDQVAVSHNLAHLAPRDEGRCRRLAWSLIVQPMPHAHRREVDAYGNQVDRFTVTDPHRTLTVSAESTIEIQPRGYLSTATPWETVVDGAPLGCEEFRYESPLVPRHPDLAEYARQDFTPGRSVLDAALGLCGRIHGEFAYDPAATTIYTPVMAVFADRRGVCQDFAQLMLGALRSLHLPARYVSGYLETLPPPGSERLVGADASHAWVQVWCGDDLGWVDIDPTNDCVPDERHIPVAYGRDFGDVSPILGMVLGGGAADVAVSVDVQRL
ncbi:MAG: Protein-glutamine gamma-glutamyltransferase [Planctomycetota bacterium]|jgi:transglutaminase-like putative cysteine protease